MRRGRRRTRVAIAVVSALAVVGVLGWGGIQLFGVFTGDKANAAGREGCAPEPSASGSPAGSAKAHGAAASASPAPGAVGKLLKPDQITVNVLNATTRTGLAQKTADELKKRGFKIGKVGNATPKYDKKVEASAVLLGPKAATDSALPVLGTQLTGTQQRTDGRKGKDVDLIIGDGFKSLSTKTAAAEALDTLAHPAPPPADRSC